MDCVICKKEIDAKGLKHCGECLIVIQRYYNDILSNAWETAVKSRKDDLALIPYEHR